MSGNGGITAPVRVRTQKADFQGSGAASSNGRHLASSIQLRSRPGRVVRPHRASWRALAGSLGKLAAGLHCRDRSRRLEYFGQCF